jgi:hypothetical protein
MLAVQRWAAACGREMAVVVAVGAAVVDGDAAAALCA